jgi:hypothetical protein
LFSSGFSVFIQSELKKYSASIQNKKELQAKQVEEKLKHLAIEWKSQFTDKQKEEYKKESHRLNAMFKQSLKKFAKTLDGDSESNLPELREYINNITERNYTKIQFTNDEDEIEHCLLNNKIIENLFADKTKKIKQNLYLFDEDEEDEDEDESENDQDEEELEEESIDSKKIKRELNASSDDDEDTNHIEKKKKNKKSKKSDD